MIPLRSVSVPSCDEARTNAGAAWKDTPGAAQGARRLHRSAPSATVALCAGKEPAGIKPGLQHTSSPRRSRRCP